MAPHLPGSSGAPPFSSTQEVFAKQGGQDLSFTVLVPGDFFLLQQPRCSQPSLCSSVSWRWGWVSIGILPGWDSTTESLWHSELSGVTLGQ